MIAKVKDFHHPFQPYGIQQDFMQAVFDCIEDGKVGIFESPTGTGKSLSLICASLTWLREHKRKAFDANLSNVDADPDEPAWLVEQDREQRYQEALSLKEDFEERLARVRKREEALRHHNAEQGHPHKKARHDDVDVNADDDGDLLLDDYHSDDEGSPHTTKAYSKSTAALLERLGFITTTDDKTDHIEEEIKVYFCSRTHSQLSQLIGEMRRVQLPATLPKDASVKSPSDTTEEPVRQLALGSRKNLCINPKVSKLSSQVAINERCLELQRAGTSAEHKCQFLPKQDEQNRLLDFRDAALAKIRDIEDLATVGKTLEICPYYASRAAIAPAEVIALPYPLILHKASREALGISLTGSVVVIDEAHNLAAAVESAYSTEISSLQLQASRADLIAYLQKFRNKLAGKNRTYVAQIVRLIDSLQAAILDLRGTGGSLTPTVLLAGKGVDQINLPKLVQYIAESKIARKVETYAARQKRRPESVEQVQPDTPILTLLANFILSLINPATEGNFFWSRDGEKVNLRYMLLDPSEHFREIVDSARAVILAGGTMSPMQDHVQQLFPHLTDVRTLSCGHIVPSSSLLVRTVVSDAQGALEFTYRTKTDTKLMQRVGLLLMKLAQTVNAGMVVFFTSYSYLDAVRQQWQTSGLLKQLNNVKKTFFDSRTQSAEKTFQMYSETVRKDARGALLCSVIGGKLSEGINFSDDLGRCVAVVGLPFPNLETPEWRVKIKYLERQPRAASKDGGRSDGSSINKEFAENICMRAVNQAIGRAIRHKNDWASIVLIDTRYAKPRIAAKLPAWIKESIPAEPVSDINSLEDEMMGFFHYHGQS